MTARPTCWPRGLLMVLEYAVARGADRRALEKRVGISLDALRTREARIPLDWYYRGIEAAAELLGAPHFGLDFIDVVEPRALDALGFLAASAPTVGEAFARILRYMRFMVDGESLALAVHGDAATFAVTTPEPPRPAHAHVVEMYLADCVLLPTRMTGHPVRLRSLRLRHAVPDPDAFARRVGFAGAEFGADRNEWTVDAALLDAPMPRADAALSAFLERVLAPQAEPYLEQPLAARARALDRADEVRVERLRRGVHPGSAPRAGPRATNLQTTGCISALRPVYTQPGGCT